MSDDYSTQTKGFGAARRPSKVGPQVPRFCISPQMAPRTITDTERKAYADYQYGDGLKSGTAAMPTKEYDTDTARK